VPTAAEHIEKAQRNEEAARLIQASYPEWAVTALFYAAMHYVEALFFTQTTKRPLPKHYDSHAKRRIAIRERASRIFNDYNTLFDDSWVARYEYEQFLSNDVDNLRDNEFEAVKSYVINRLPLDLRTIP